MRSPPEPSLQSVLVNGTVQGFTVGTVAHHDDLLAAAVLAAGDVQDVKNRSRSVLARVQRRWSRFSESIWRRRKDERRVRDVITPPVVVLDTFGRVAIDAVPMDKKDYVPDAQSHVILHRERELKIKRHEELEIDEELAVHSTTMRRVRQVGARDNDDTLLLLPRVEPITFSAPDSKEDEQHVSVRRVQLPRVSALMPMRASPRPLLPLANVSSVSSSDKESPENCLSHDEDQSFSSRDSYGRERNETWDVGDSHMRRNMFFRLPTGLSTKDVEREIDHAVVEIASDSGTESDDTTAHQKSAIQDWKHKTNDTDICRNTRALSDAHHHRSRPRNAPFSRRVSSSIQSMRKATDQSDKGQLPLSTEKSNINTSHDFALFEDDYLSFKGFHLSQSDGRSHQSMAGLLRGKRISSVTDSHSEDSEEYSNNKPLCMTDCRRVTVRSPSQGQRIRQTHNIPTDNIPNADPI